MNIPSLPFGQIVDKDGNPTDSYLIFLQNLLTALQSAIGPSGNECQQLLAADITTIQDATIVDPSNALAVIYTCQYGTRVYDSTNNVIKIAIDNGAGAPIFKTVTLT